MKNLLGLSLQELEELLKSHTIKPVKAKELFKLINKKLSTDLDELTSFKQFERELLKKKHFISTLALKNLQKGQHTQKAAFKLNDGQIIETAFIDQNKERKTICLSSQVGCPIGCKFCATGQMGFKRNLTSTEIISQAYFFAQTEIISNIVFMGMGEPFLNFDNTVKAAKILNSPSGQNLATRKIVFSTIGIISGIEKLAKVKEPFRLAWSLVSPFEENRRKLIPYQKLPSIKETIAALANYQKKIRRRVTISYVLLKGINDTKKDIEELIKISRQLDALVNLIAYNPSPGLPFEEGNITATKELLQKEKILVTIRKSLGQDISAACGQLST